MAPSRAPKRPPGAIALVSFDATVGDLAGNARRIAALAREAAAAGASVVLFPELALTGYPPKDLVDLPDFRREAASRLRELAKVSRAVPLLVGSIEERRAATGKPLHNAAFWLAGGKVAAVYRKRLLPTYDVFDEGRHFEPGSGATIVRSPAGRLGLTICEDAWNDKTFWTRRLYDEDPVADAARGGADLVVNISASPFSVGKRALRRRMLGALARRWKRPLLSVASVGGNDELLFDGGSGAFDAAGRLVAATAPFEEGILVVDPADLAPRRMPEVPRFPSDPADELDVIWTALVAGTRDYARKCGFRSAVLGLSGGIDSALTAAIAAEALGAENVLGVSLPSAISSTGSLEDAEALARNLRIGYQVLPIAPAVEVLRATLAPHFAGRAEDVTEENLQARARGVLLMALSNKFGHLLLTTGNKSELAVGYCTLYGDMCGGLAVISDVPKTLVWALSRWRNREGEVIPRSSIEKPPSAELRPGQTDQDSLPPYDLLDAILELAVEEQRPAARIAKETGAPLALVRKVLGMVDRSEYKRQQAAPGLRITRKAFGAGRRMPIAQGFRR